MFDVKIAVYDKVIIKWFEVVGELSIFYVMFWGKYKAAMVSDVFFIFRLIAQDCRKDWETLGKG